MSQSSIAPQTAPPRLHFRVSPEPSRLLRARERLRDYLRQYCTESQVIDDVVLCVEEACTNAIRHSGAAQDIEISLQFDPDRLVALVKDRGRGFDVASFDPHLLPDPLADHGRGLFIIAALMDSLELRLEGGLEVRMARRAEPRCEPAPLESGLGEPRTADGVGQREARTRALLEEIDEAFVALDWEYRYIYANERACRLLGRSRDELLGHTPFALFAKLRGSDLERGFRAAMELGNPTVMEWRSPVIGAAVEVRIYPTPAGVSAYFHDISERKRKEDERDQYLAALRESEQRLRFHLENTPMAVIEWDAQFVVTRWAGEAERMFGWSEVETVGRPIVDLNMAYEADIPIVEATMGRLTDGVSHQDVSANRNVTKDGRVIDCTWYNSVRLDDDGAMASVMSLVLDNTERKQAELERERLVAELQARSADLHERTASLARRVALDESLERVNRLIYSTLEFDEIMQRALDEATEALGTEAGSIEMREQGAWSVRYQRGFDAPNGGLRLSDAEAPVATRAALSGEPLAVEDLLLETETDVAFLRGQQLRSTLAVPLIVRGVVVGCLLFHGRTPRVFTPPELDFARKLGSSVSLALENARLSEHETEGGRFDEALTWSRTTQFVRRLRAHPWRVLVAAIAIESAILAALGAVSDTRRILGVPGSLVALMAVMAGALAGPLVGALVAVAGGVVFFMTVGDFGSRSSVWTTAISTAIWLAAGLVSGFLARGLREQTERRRAAAVALARADAARDAQLTEQSRIEELATGLQAQTDALAERADLADALNAINGVVHSTLDFDDIMQRALAQGVAALNADAGTIELREEDSWVVAHQHGLSGEEVGLRLGAEQAPIASRAWATAQPFAIADLELEPQLNVGFPRAHGLRTVLVVPLIVRQLVTGCLLLFGREPRTFSEAEIDFARKLGVTVALAVDNARLYHDQQRIAQTLQENFIHPLPTVAGLELGMVAQAATQPELVGGDFSDVFLIDDDHVAVLIGDVAGKGVRAAGHTETVRSEVRALAMIDSSPAFVLAKTNELLLRFDPDEPHVTAFLAVLDPHTGHLSYASAGHPAPVHLGAFSARLLDVAFGPPLGSFERSYRNGHAMLTLEDYLVFYTDGVTEARRGSELLGAERLLAVVSGLRGRSAQEVAEGVRAAALAFAGRLRDDLQVVVLRLA